MLSDRNSNPIPSKRPMTEIRERGARPKVRSRGFLEMHDPVKGHRFSNFIEVLHVRIQYLLHLFYFTSPYNE